MDNIKETFHTGERLIWFEGVAAWLELLNKMNQDAETGYLHLKSNEPDISLRSQLVTLVQDILMYLLTWGVCDIDV